MRESEQSFCSQKQSCTVTKENLYEEDTQNTSSKTDHSFTVWNFKKKRETFIYQKFRKEQIE